MVVVEADGNYVKPFTVEDLDICSGESYSVLLTTDQDPHSNYWISLSVRFRQPKTPPALTLLHYLPTSGAALPSSPPPTPPLWNDYAHAKSFQRRILDAGIHSTPTPAGAPDRRIVLLNTQNRIDGYTKWAINNVSLALPNAPQLGSLKLGLGVGPNTARDDFPASYDITKPAANPNATYGNGVYELRFNTTVDVILQNANALAANVSEVHPWHLHGHDFWVLGHGEGRFAAGRDGARLNLARDAPRRNTAVLFPYGWTALRFAADNPGVWAFHCHIEPHLHMGMGVVFAEGVRRVGRIPTEAISCGVIARKIMNGGGGN